MGLFPSTHSLRSLLLLSLSYRLFITALLRLFTLYVPLFDHSPDFVLPRGFFLQAFVRWDVVWFLRIIQKGGYTHEQDTAFAPGWLWVIKKMGRVVGTVKEAMGGGGEVKITPDNLMLGGKGVDDLVLGGVLASWLAGMMSTVVLYRLTLRLTSSPSFAHLTSLVYILSPSPGALVSPYTEPLYAFLTFSGMLASTASPSPSKLRLPGLLLATIFFALSTSVRPLGIMNAGYLIWGLVVEPWLQGRGRGWKKILPRLLFASTLTLVIAAPFIQSQYKFYLGFCTPRLPPPFPRLIWCDRRVPLVYAFVQKEYWNVGFLRYFTLSQLPNFLISSPIYLLLLYTHSFTLPHQYKTYLHPLLPRSIACALEETFQTLLSSNLLPKNILVEARRALSPAETLLATKKEILPYLIHSLVLTGVLFFNSHVQIVLRLAQTNPVVWWGVASLVGRREGGFVPPPPPPPLPTTPMDLALEELEVLDEEEKEVVVVEEEASTRREESTKKPDRKRRRVGRSPSPSPTLKEDTKEVVVVEKRRRMYFWGRVYLGWVVVWGLVATLLWAGFYPPA